MGGATNDTLEAQFHDIADLKSLAVNTKKLRKGAVGAVEGRLRARARELMFGASRDQADAVGDVAAQRGSEVMQPQPLTRRHRT
jgi:hypothetical protein